MSETENVVQNPVVEAVKEVKEKVKKAAKALKGKVSGKKAPVKKAPVKKAAKKGTKAPAKKEPAERQSKWLVPVAKLLAKNPNGLTRQEIWAKLNTNNLGGVLVNRTDLFKAEQHEGERGFTFSLTAAGKKFAASN